MSRRSEVEGPHAVVVDGKLWAKELAWRRAQSESTESSQLCSNRGSKIQTIWTDGSRHWSGYAYCKTWLCQGCARYRAAHELGLLHHVTTECGATRFYLHRLGGIGVSADEAARERQRLQKRARREGVDVVMMRRTVLGVKEVFLLSSSALGTEVAAIDQRTLMRALRREVLSLPGVTRVPAYSDGEWKGLRDDAEELSKISPVGSWGRAGQRTVERLDKLARSSAEEGSGPLMVDDGRQVRRRRHVPTKEYDDYMRKLLEIARSEE